MSVTGECYCGKVKFEIKAEKPLFAGYCHCKSCRVAHAAPMYNVAILPRSSFFITEGEDLVNHFRKDPSSIIFRNFCSNCGTRLFNDFRAEEGVSAFPPGDYAGTFPALYHYIPESFKPQMHIRCIEAVYEIPEKCNDGLVKFPEWPTPPSNQK